MRWMRLFAKESREVPLVFLLVMWLIGSSSFVWPLYCVEECGRWFLLDELVSEWVLLTVGSGLLM